MTNKVNTVLNQALELTAAERADVVEKLLVSLDVPDPAIDAIWAKEADSRVEAYERGELEAVPAEEVFGKYPRS
jgi:putative addiction module component (TIGR02574 family)